MPTVQVQSDPKVLTIESATKGSDTCVWPYTIIQEHLHLKYIFSAHICQHPATRHTIANHPALPNAACNAHQPRPFSSHSLRTGCDNPPNPNSQPVPHDGATLVADHGDLCRGNRVHHRPDNRSAVSSLRHLELAPTSGPGSIPRPIPVSMQRLEHPACYCPFLHREITADVKLTAIPCQTPSTPARPCYPSDATLDSVSQSPSRRAPRSTGSMSRPLICTLGWSAIADASRLPLLRRTSVSWQERR